MKRLNVNRKRFSGSSAYVGIAIIAITLLIVIYLVQKSLTYKEYPYNKLIEDSTFYKSSTIEGWHKITFSSFQVEVPKTYKYFKIQGYDSFVGGITDKVDTIEFDYGWYSNPLKEYENNEKFSVEYERINGKKFKIVKQKDKSGFAGAYTNDLENNNSLMIICANCKDLDDKLEIFKTIKFN